MQKYVKTEENGPVSAVWERLSSVMNWEKNVRKVVPYVPGEQPKQENVIKLNTNENPYPPAPGVREALRQFPAEKLRLYPDTQALELVEALADFYGVNRDEIFVGVGSDDVLAMSFLTFFNGKEPVLFPDITYSFYDVWAKLFGIPYETKPLDAKLRLVAEDYMGRNGGIIFPNPNAPTGVLESLDTIERIVKANPDVVVIVDEAYIDFGGVSALPLIRKYENLLVVQTFSKSRNLAGSRIGFAMGCKKLIDYLKDVKFSFNSYTMDSVTVALGAACVRDRAYFEQTMEKVIATREWTKQELGKLGFSFPDSRSNFIFATHERVPAGKLFEALKAENIYVRYFAKPRIDNYLRITIGTDEQMKKLVEFLKTYLAEK